MAEASCGHLDHVHHVKAKTEGCEECLKMGDSWVHLRLCMECGHVGCCDSSKNKHGTKHFHHTKHPIMRSIESICGLGYDAFFLNDGGVRPISRFDPTVHHQPSRPGYVFNFIFRPRDG